MDCLLVPKMVRFLLFVLLSSASTRRSSSALAGRWTTVVRTRSGYAASGAHSTSITVGDEYSPSKRVFKTNWHSSGTQSLELNEFGSGCRDGVKLTSQSTVVGLLGTS